MRRFPVEGPTTGRTVLESMSLCDIALSVPSVAEFPDRNRGNADHEAADPQPDRPLCVPTRLEDARVHQDNQSDSDAHERHRDYPHPPRNGVQLTPPRRVRRLGASGRRTSWYSFTALPEPGGCDNASDDADEDHQVHPLRALPDQLSREVERNANDRPHTGHRPRPNVRMNVWPRSHATRSLPKPAHPYVESYHLLATCRPRESAKDPLLMQRLQSR